MQDIVDRPPAVERLVASASVEGQGPKQFAVVGDDAHVCTRDQQSDLAVAMYSSHRNVSELAQVADGDLAEAINFVAANAMDCEHRTHNCGN